LNLRKAAIFTFHGSVLAILNQHEVVANGMKQRELMIEPPIADLFRWTLEKYVSFDVR